MKIQKSIPQIKRNISDAKTQVQRHEKAAESASAKETGALAKLQAKEKAFATATANMEKIGAKKSSLDAEIKDLRAQAAKAIAGDVSPLGRNAMKHFSAGMAKLAQSDAPQADVTVGELRADKSGAKTKASLLKKADALQKKSNSYKGIFKSYTNTINSLAIDIDHLKSDAAAQGRVVGNHVAALGEATATLAQNQSELKDALALQGAGNGIGSTLADVTTQQASAAPSETGMLTGAEVVENLLGFAKTMLTAFAQAFTETLAEQGMPALGIGPTTLGGPGAPSAGAFFGDAVQKMATNMLEQKFSVPTKTPTPYSPPSQFDLKLNELDLQADTLRSDARALVSKVKSGTMSKGDALGALKSLSDKAALGGGEVGQIMAKRSQTRAKDLTPSDAVHINIGLGDDLREIAQNMVDGANASGRAHATTFSGEAVVVHPGDDPADVLADYVKWSASQTNGDSARTARYDIDDLAQEILAAG